MYAKREKWVVPCIKAIQNTRNHYHYLRSTWHLRQSIEILWHIYYLYKAHTVVENFPEKSQLCKQSVNLNLINSFEFWQILVIYSIKRITKNQTEFSRGKNVSPKVFKVFVRRKWGRPSPSPWLGRWVGALPQIFFLSAVDLWRLAGQESIFFCHGKNTFLILSLCISKILYSGQTNFSLCSFLQKIKVANGVKNTLGQICAICPKIHILKV